MRRSVFGNYRDLSWRSPTQRTRSREVRYATNPMRKLYRWLALLPNPARGTFASPPTPGAWLPPDQPLEPGWDELSFLDVLLSTETHIGDVEYISEKLGKLQFSALAWPYGGIGSMLRLVEAFGFRITSYDEGSMPEVTRDQHLSWSTK